MRGEVIKVTVASVDQDKTQVPSIIRANYEKKNSRPWRRGRKE